MSEAVATRAWIAPMFIKIAVLYFIVGVLLGIYMAAKVNYVQAPVHAHLNLLGWSSLAIGGLIYAHYPQAGRHVLAAWHFWLANLSLPVMMIALWFYVQGNQDVAPVLGISSTVMGVGVLLFAINVWINVAARRD